MKKTSSVIILFIIIIGAVLGATFFLKSRQPTNSPQKLNVVTAFLPIYVFTKNITGDLANVENLLPPNIGPHDYSPTPQDIVKVASADIIIKHGRGIDNWLNSITVAAQKPESIIVNASEGIEPHTGPIGFNIEGGPTPSRANIPLVRPDPEDPHTWLDPFLAIKEVENIRDALMEKNPANRDDYAKNAEVYILKLLALDGAIRDALANLPRRDFVAFHPAFRYFAYEYGLREVAVIEETPGREPTPAELTQIIDTIRQYNVRTVFGEPQFSPKIIETLASDYNLFIVQIDPLETGELRADYYEEVMRRNMEAVSEALGARN